VLPSEGLKQPKTGEEKAKTEPESQLTKDPKMSQKKGEPISSMKEGKKSKQYDVSHGRSLCSVADVMLHANRVWVEGNVTLIHYFQCLR
jgi:hypothetical protein